MIKPIAFFRIRLSISINRDSISKSGKPKTNNPKIPKIPNPQGSSLKKLNHREKRIITK
jgi:hypothetical protein|tara:strand:- start:177 stop:353 length:177 start_codon:yes stop_codon:yes gene_type:complete